MSTNDPQEPYVSLNDAFATGEGIARAIIADHGIEKARHILCGMRRAFVEQANAFLNEKSMSMNKEECNAAMSILVQCAVALNEITEENGRNDLSAISRAVRSTPLGRSAGLRTPAHNSRSNRSSRLT